MSDVTTPSGGKSSEEPELDADGRFRPAFVRDFPKDPDLERLVAAFERGDFHGLRQKASKLATSTSDAAVKAACEELLRRIQPDPMVRLLLLGSFACFAFLALWAYLK